MNRSSASLLTVILSAGLLTPAAAGVVHKWVDASGQTHYSDAPPAIAPTGLTLIEMPDRAKSTAAGTDYYSIQNQWRRIHAERLARERIRLEQAREAAAKRAAEPTIIHVREPRPRRHALVLPGFGRGAHRGHHRHWPARLYGGYGYPRPWHKYRALRAKHGPVKRRNF